MLSALLLGLSQPGISLEIPGRPLFEVLAKLETLTNEKLETAAEIKHLPLILKVTNQPWSEVKKQIAWATWATWVERDGMWVLQRTKANRDDFSRQQFEQRKLRLKPFFDGYVKRATASGDWGKEASLRRQPSENARFGSLIGLSRKLCAKMGATSFAADPECATWCFPARSNETPFPNESIVMVEELLAQFNRTHRTTDQGLATQLVLTGVSLGRFDLLFADSKSNVLLRMTETIETSQSELSFVPPQGKIQLDSVVQNWQDFRSQPGIAVTPELEKAIFDPVATDPYQLDVGPMLLEASFGWRANVIATIYHPAMLMRVDRENRADILLRKLAQNCELKATRDWLQIRDLRGPLAPSVDRKTMKAFLQRARSATTSRQLAEVLHELTALPARQAFEIAHPILSLYAPAQFNRLEVPLAQYFAKAREPFRRVVRLTSTERLKLYETLRKNQFWYGIVQEANGTKSAKMLYNSLDILPSRTFSNGVPIEVELEFDPNLASPPGSLRFSEVESMAGALALSSYEYAQYLLDVKSSLGKKKLSWFVEPGMAGGLISYRFANGVVLRLVGSVWATHPKSQAKPIGDLPTEFANEAKQMLEGLERDQRSPPPPAQPCVY